MSFKVGRGVPTNPLVLLLSGIHYAKHVQQLYLASMIMPRVRTNTSARKAKSSTSHICIPFRWTSVSAVSRIQKVIRTSWMRSNLGCKAYECFRCNIDREDIYESIQFCFECAFSLLIGYLIGRNFVGRK